MKSKIIGKRQILTISLITAFSLAVFVNWYYTKTPENISEPKTTEQVNLGDAQYVSSDNVKENYYNSAIINRTKAHDSAKEHLKEIIADKNNDKETIVMAREKLTQLSDHIKTEADIENLIKAQVGIICLVTCDSDSIEIILPKGAVTEETLLKINNIVITKTDYNQDCITIVEVK